MSAPPVTPSTMAPLENDDILRLVLSYVGPKQYRFVAIINKQFKKVYKEIFPKNTRTRLNASTVGHAEICWNEINPRNRNHQESKLCIYAAKHGNLPALQYLHSMNCSWNRATCYCAAMNGHLDILQYARDNGCPWDEYTCQCAAENGHLEVLQYAHENGCPWDATTCRCAAENGHLEVLQFAHENGCPWDAERTYSAALCNGHINILQYLHENGCPWDATSCRFAVLSGHLHILQYLHKNGCPWDRESILSLAKEYNRAHMIQWIQSLS